ncbi:25843_t:CDS:2 [Gigaspora margarita]|uniref:25843_t:CDS:1 n=1 Tax=Gigaspora margarita TaxID=4874 RepID=A0ABN7UF95_GIGMA|nr:25843_t:CDS:2 [Gigaspora margarita]
MKSTKENSPVKANLLMKVQQKYISKSPSEKLNEKINKQKSDDKSSIMKSTEQINKVEILVCHLEEKANEVEMLKIKGALPRRTKKNKQKVAMWMEMNIINIITKQHG